MINRARTTGKPIAALLSTLGCLMVCQGCGDDRGLVPVSGRVTFNGGEMPGKGYLRFVTLEVGDGFSRRSGMAKFDTDGSYEVRSFKPGDGLLPGTYAVFPYCWEVEPNMDGRPEKSYLPAKYLNPIEPQFKLTVEKGQSAIDDFDVNIEP